MKMWAKLRSLRHIGDQKYRFGHDVSLDGVRRVHFMKSEWENFDRNPDSVSTRYLAYRCFYLTAVCTILSFSIGCSAFVHSHTSEVNPSLHFYFIFLTHWSIITQVIYGVVFAIRLAILRCTYGNVLQGNQNQAVEGAYNQNPELPHSQHHTEEQVVIVSVFEHKQDKVPIVVDPLPVADKIIWVLFNCTTVLPTFVTIGFWGFLYTFSVNTQPNDQLQQQVMESWCIIPTGLQVHGLNMVLFFIDLMVVAIPFRLAHFIQVGVYGFLYGAFTGFYELAGGTYINPERPFIYPFLNWHQTPGAALTAMYFAIVLGGLLYSINVIFYRFRLWIVGKCVKPGAKHEHEYKFRWMRRQTVIRVHVPSCVCETLCCCSAHKAKIN